jgi:uncharacterized membrane protein YjjP (DUF1212 family)
MPEDLDPVALKHRELEQIAMVALRAARLMMESGGRAQVVRNCGAMVAVGLGAETVALRGGYASMEITVTSGINTSTRMIAVGRLGVNHRLDQAIRQLASRVAKGGMTIGETSEELSRLARTTPRHPAWFVAIAVGLACTAFGRLLGLDWPAFLPVLVAGGVGQYTRHTLLAHGTNPFLVAALIAFLSATIGGFGARLAGSAMVDLAMMASILLLVPGVPATNAQADIMDGYPTLGSAQAVSVIMVMVFAATGVLFAQALLGLRLRP